MAAAFLAFIFFGLTSKQRKREIARQKDTCRELSTAEVYKEIFHYSLPAILSTIATSAPSLIDSNQCIRRLMVAGFSNIRANELYGIYSYQYQRLFTLAIAFSTALVTAMVPAVSSALAVKDYRLVKHKISESYKAIYIITVPSIAGISFLAQPIISLIWFDMDAGGADLVAFGTWTAILMTIQYVQTSILIAIGKPVIASVNQIISMAAKVLLNYLLIAIPSINISGAIIGTAVSWIISIVLNQYVISRCLRFKVYFLRLLIKPAFASAIMGGVCFFVYNGLAKLLYLIFHHGKAQLYLSDFALIAAVAVGVAVYAVIMIKIKGITKNDILRMPMGKRIYRSAVKFTFLRSSLEVQ